MPGAKRSQGGGLRLPPRRKAKASLLEPSLIIQQTLAPEGPKKGFFEKNKIKAALCVAAIVGLAHWAQVPVETIYAMVSGLVTFILGESGADAVGAYVSAKKKSGG